MQKHYIRYDIQFDAYPWYIREPQGVDGKPPALARPVDVVMESYEKGTIQSPFMTLLDSDVQQIMNQLWEAGVRPRDGAGSLAHIEAKDDHIATLKLSHQALLESVIVRLPVARLLKNGPILEQQPPTRSRSYRGRRCITRVDSRRCRCR